jgi:hypothetical protein
MTKRNCGGCTLCCRLVPVAEIGKLAGQRCAHQRHGKGCAVYQTRPLSCSGWSCGWLKDEDDAGELSRPDRAHYVIDQRPDFVTMVIGEEEQKMPVLQIWCDPAHRDAHRDPALRRYLSGGPVAALIRYNSSDAILIVPPEITGSGWYESAAGMGRREHTNAEILEVAGMLDITGAP